MAQRAPVQTQTTLGGIESDGEIADGTPRSLLETVTPGDRVRFNDKQQALTVTADNRPENVERLSARHVVLRGPYGGKYVLRVPQSEEATIIVLGGEGEIIGGITFLEIAEHRDSVNAPRVAFYDDREE